ncbi:hypothetical protein [Paenibacillus abyssi]|uniref:hypothetical protein n=1 Tax=Paenibacillus abyssi TaxID=1340531 RepID=UPI001668A2B0|nr:hypothetical protein [Paenibacillus abyssi]
MELIINESFENETITFDGFNFVGCTFKNCIVIITSMDFDFERCTFTGTTFHVNPHIPIFQISHRISQSSCDDIACFWDGVYKAPGTDLHVVK